ncbi:MAG: cytochrome c [Gammaproteobacteria bacterium]|nr:cytochrome c [Gammaproteobacteria bacterium]MDE2346054.1 cytochrome c [Gammaproteobacteria bacterium]
MVEGRKLCTRQRRCRARQSCGAGPLRPCHGADGNSGNPQYPKLAGQNPYYIYAQLQAFRSGQRSSVIMAGMVAVLSAQDANDAAAYLSAQTPQPDVVNDAKLAEAGRRIYFASLGPGMMNTCASCRHGGRRGGMSMMMGGMGMMGRSTAGTVAIPRLNGQHAAYILDQLNRFASGQRAGSVCPTWRRRWTNSNARQWPNTLQVSSRFQATRA